MATITKLGLQDPNNQQGASPYGNITAFRYVLKTNAAGAVVGADADDGGFLAHFLQADGKQRAVLVASSSVISAHF